MSDLTPRRWRTIFISDVHLGTRGCRAKELLDFLRHNDAETIYLVGDIVDFWRLKHRVFWAHDHNDVVQKLLRKARKGTRVVFVPGNHDEAMDQFWDWHFGNIEVLQETTHTTADGRQLLVIHGDQFDGVVRYARWLVMFGDMSYIMAIWSNRAVNAIRSRLGLEHWSLAGYLKEHFKHIVEFIDRFENAVCEEASRRGFDGVVCGHIHHAANKHINGLHYLNCGDWVESCTALVEDHDGNIAIVRHPGDAKITEPARTSSRRQRKLAPVA